VVHNKESLSQKGGHLSELQAQLPSVLASMQHRAEQLAGALATLGPTSAQLQNTEAQLAKEKQDKLHSLKLLDAILLLESQEAGHEAHVQSYLRSSGPTQPASRPWLRWQATLRSVRLSLMPNRGRTAAHWPDQMRRSPSMHGPGTSLPACCGLSCGKWRLSKLHMRPHMQRGHPTSDKPTCTDTGLPLGHLKLSLTDHSSPPMMNYDDLCTLYKNNRPFLPAGA
jgi:hypothetical protein